MPYPRTVTQFESEMTALAAAAPTLVKKTAFPNATVIDGGGSTTYSFLEIANGAGPGRVTALAIAGMHAREWAQPDAALTFAQKLIAAYQVGGAFVIPAYTEGGNTFGPVSASSATVKALVDKLNIIIVPVANPDGRAFTQASTATTNKMWRKNRAPRPSPGDPDTAVGVDPNRNFDIAWDYDVYYSPAFIASGALHSSKTATEVVFIGKPRPAPNQAHPDNEIEAKNLIWLLDNRPVTFSVDLHSALLKIMHPWGIERNGSNPAQTFMDPTFDTKRDGTLGNAYSEFFPNTAPARLLDKHRQIAGSMHDRILAATGRDYKFGGIADIVYPANGSFTDFHFSRQFTIPGSPQIFAFATEFGDNGDSFQPHPTTPKGYAKIEREIHAFLLAFFEAALASIPAPAPGTGSGSGSSGGGICSLSFAAAEVMFGKKWLDALRRGRAVLLGGRRTRGAMLALDRGYRRLSAAILPFMFRHRWARLAIAYGILAPSAIATDFILKWNER